MISLLPYIPLVLIYIWQSYSYFKEYCKVHDEVTELRREVAELRGMVKKNDPD